MFKGRYDYPYVRAVCTGVKNAPVGLYTGRIYGPYIRVSKIHPYIRAVHTARIYGPYLRVVRIGLKSGPTIFYVPAYREGH